MKRPLIKTAGVIPVLFLFLIILNGCIKSKEVNYEPFRGNEIRVGVLLSLTGSGSSSGESSQASLQLAKTDIQAWLNSMGMKAGLNLIIEDTKTDTAIALEKLRNFFSQGIRWVIGPYSSAELAHIKPFADRNGILVISPSSVAVSLAIPGDNIFRFVSSDRIQGEAMTALLTDNKIKRLIPVIRDDVWGNDLLGATSKDFSAQGGSVAPPVKYNVSAMNLPVILADLDNAVGEALQTYGQSEVGIYLLCFAEGSSILKGAREKENLLKVRWYGGSAYALNSSLLADTAAARFASLHGLPCPLYGLDESARYIWEPLRSRIAAIIGRQPDVYALTAYDALWVVVRTILALEGNNDIVKMKQYFTDQSDHYFGASGNTMLNEAGDRAMGNYDFWAVSPLLPNGFEWKRVAWYNSATGSLVKL
jgi:branched-chain amino acid transport system substrate-binding protein